MSCHGHPKMFEVSKDQDSKTTPANCIILLGTLTKSASTRGFPSSNAAKDVPRQPRHTFSWPPWKLRSQRHLHKWHDVKSIPNNLFWLLCHLRSHWYLPFENLLIAQMFFLHMLVCGVPLGKHSPPETWFSTRDNSWFFILLLAIWSSKSSRIFMCEGICSRLLASDVTKSILQVYIVQGNIEALHYTSFMLQTTAN